MKKIYNSITIKILFTLLLISPQMSVFAQDDYPADKPKVDYSKKNLKLDPETNLLTNYRIIEVESMPKDVIYGKVKAWFGENFVSSKNVIISDVPSEGMIKGLYTDSYPLSGFMHPFYNNITVYIKDNRAKVVINRIYLVAGGYTAEKYMVKKDGTYPRSMYNNLFETIDLKTTATIKSLETYLNKSDNW